MSTDPAEVPASKLTPTELSSLIHWSMYGQPGEPPASRVQKSDWRDIHSFKSPQSAPWDVPLQAEQLQKLLLGFKPREREDKWFVYSEGADDGRLVVRFYRSWTGFEIAEMDVMVGNGENGSAEGVARITGITWEESEDVMKEQREDDAKETVREVCRWVLGVELPEESDSPKPKNS